MKYADAIIGKTFTIVQTPDLKLGDVVIPLNVGNVGHEIPRKIVKITRITDEFYDVEFEKRNHRELPRFSRACIFGRLVE